MGIPESQLETWSHQGAIITAKSTADSVKNALDSYESWPSGIEYEVYLQGSYKNSTNIRGDSDVDVIAQLSSTFYSNLSEEQKKLLRLKPASYGWEDFRLDVLNSLKKYYGSDQVKEGNKSLKIKAGSGRLPADVVVCAQYRQYAASLNINDYVEGMTFWTKLGNRQIINYPKLHYQNGVQKHQNTKDWWKPAVRMFKNIRTHLVDRGEIEKDLAPSYFLECLLYNVPNNQFGKSFQDTFCDVVNWINDISLENFVCQNEHLHLFGLTPEQWSQDKAKLFIQNLIELWNNWNG